MMRFSFLTTVVLAVVACGNTPKTTVGIRLSGEGYPYDAHLVMSDSVYSTNVDSLGMAKFVLAENAKAEYATLKLNRLQFPVYIEPGKSFDFILPFVGNRLVPVFEGAGAKKCQYLNNCSIKQFYPKMTMDETDFLNHLKEQEEIACREVDAAGLDPDFVQLEKKRVHYLLAAALGHYVLTRHTWVYDGEYVPSAHMYDQLETVVQEEDNLLGVKTYQDAILAKVNAFAKRGWAGDDALEYLYRKLDFIRENIKSPRVAEYLVDRYVSDRIAVSSVDGMDDALAFYNKTVTSPEILAKSDRLFGKWKKIAKGQSLPDIKCLDADGKEVSLTEFRGKYVYIDFWASWCGPCRAQSRHLRKLEESFKGRNIQFVSISVDQKKDAWLQAVKEDKLEGVQLHTGGDRQLEHYLLITGIPRFVLLDREGKIVTALMTRPSEPETAKTLEALEGI